MDYSTLKSKIENHRPKIIGTKRANSVLLPVIKTAKGVCLLLEVRSQNVWQPGEVCLPGGGVEEGEAPKDAAIREASEELGIAKEKIKILGQFDTVVGLGGFILDSFVGELDISEEEIKDLNFDKNEVEKLFLVPLSWLKENSPKTFSFPTHIDIPENFDYSVLGLTGPYNWRKNEHDIVVWHFEGQYIWGLTAKILYEFVTVFLD